jgi:predicted DNA-binding transcriptional regulator YafY
MTADKDGWFRCTIPVESGLTGARELLRLGEDVEILSPAPLRALMAKTARAIAKRHARS